MIGRREALAVGIYGVGIGVSSAVQACTLLPTRKPIAFRNGACEQNLRELVAFANIAHGKSEDEVANWQESTAPRLTYDGDSRSVVAFLRQMRVSDDKVDPKPIRLGELNLIRQISNKVTYAFTLHRNQYFGADNEGCNGLFTHGEYFADTETAYLAMFVNNEFVSFKEFPEWYVE